MRLLVTLLVFAPSAFADVCNIAYPYNEAPLFVMYSLQEIAEDLRTSPDRVGAVIISFGLDPKCNEHEPKSFDKTYDDYEDECLLFDRITSKGNTATLEVSGIVERRPNSVTVVGWASSLGQEHGSAMIFDARLFVPGVKEITVSATSDREEDWHCEQ